MPLTNIEAILDDDFPKSDKNCMFQCALEEGDCEVLKTYIKKYGKTPYRMEGVIYDAIQYNRGEIIHLLLEFGADVNEIYSDGFTLLHIAAQYGACRTLFPLIFAGAKLDSKNDHGWTPLHYAAASDFVATDLIGILLDFGANIDPVNNAGYTPIFEAMDLIGHQKEAISNVQYLLARGANIHARLPDGSTLLHVAADALNYINEVYTGEMLSICRLLIERGLSICDLRNDGASVLSICHTSAAVAALEKISFESKFLHAPPATHKF
ncbi:Ankyrin repeat [Methylomagnum ishizawai]|uniref:Ankyrin repeat n=1 Tax=Methylomagnum ishizawai TaxID=1760988 RepID=A0A1Y6CVY0_9GAMM|nr:ankyrin repeat domain-containing protein [Methylomagnum ishizawai]SMF94390.1 Ankyrin repeat [Methylomagnum ishizawai]